MTQNHNARELALFINNDGAMYRTRTVPVMNNLADKMARGIFDESKALTLWTHVATEGARRYGKEFGNGERDGLAMFSVADRKEAAAELMDTYRQDIEEGAAQMKTERENRKKWTLSAIKAAATGYFFTRETMKFHGDTMKSFRVECKADQIFIVRKSNGTTWQFNPETGAILPA